MKKTLLAYFGIFICAFSYAQAPPNDLCSNATSLGTLPTPAACPVGTGAAVTTTGTTINATGSNPYTTLLGCQTGGNQPGPAIDVWYTVVATGNSIVVNITPGSAPALQNPAITLWSGNCTALVGYNCDNDGTVAGNNTATFAPTAPGTTYYIEISGMNATSTGNFNLSVNNNNDCNNCNLISTLTATPAPVNGTYGPGQTVTFCYTISSYAQVSSNWLHGVVPTFGCGWNLATLVPGNPNEISTNGQWGWYNSCTSSANGTTTGPGFYFNYFAPADGNPGNNYGDYNPTSLPWTFCWTITTSTSCACTNLNININTLGDGESGSWTSIACLGDPNYNFAAVMNCCSVTASGTNNTCFGGSTGTATATQTSGTGPYTYSWSTTPVQTSTTATGLPAGTYTVTSTDNVGCVSTATVTITQPPAITAIPSQTNVTCNGSCTGTASVVAGGGTGTYTYNWTPVPGGGQGTANATGLCAGTYSCTISSPAGCTFTQTFNITQPPPITTTQSQVNITCNGACNGSASVVASGGTGTYTYVWTPAPGGGQGTANATGLCAATYSCTVSSPAGCSSTATFNITQPPAITATPSQVNLLCNAVCNGTASVVAAGGTGTYTYNWTPVPGGGQGTANATGLCAGTYSCVISSPAGCVFTQTFNITQPTALTITPSQTNITCNGGCDGTATSAVTGGTPPYSYSWTPSGATTATATALCVGIQTVTVTDANGCTLTQTFNITQPTAVSGTTSTVQATCNMSNGSATATGSGGVGPYTYSWNTSPVQNTQTASNIPAGTYTCTITDANLCTFTITATVTNAAAGTASITAFTNVTCFGACDGTATVAGAGGTPPYSYNWLPSGGTAANATGLCPNVYTVTVTDANGCTATASVTITEPTAITVSGTQVDVNCNAACNGSATITASGGTPPYNYSWSSGGTGSTESSLCAGSYTCTITDANGCTATQTFTITEPAALTVAAAGFNVTCFGSCDGQIVAIPSGGTPAYTFAWSNGCTSASCNSMCAGTYNLTVTDANGCTVPATVTVTEPTAITINATAIDANCGQSDGSVSATASGGTGTLTYQWIGGPASQNWNNIGAGTYSIIVTDVNGCDDTVSVVVNNTAGIIASIASVINVTCNGACDGVITGATVGGTGTITYSWNPSAGTAISTMPSCAGTYTFTATDSVGCSATSTATITEPTPLVVNASASPNSVCTGGQVTLAGPASGGTGPYSYNWTPFGLTTAGGTISPTSSGNATQIVTDANGCIDSASVSITVNPDPVALLAGDSLSGCAPLCVNFSDLSTIASGNITSWSWDFGDGNTSTSQNPYHCYSTAGPYTIILTVTSNGGCVNTVTMPNYINVFANPVAAFTAGPQPTTELDPTIFFTDASTNASSWLWSFGDTTNATSTLQNPSFPYPGSGCYQVILTVATSNNCIDTAMQNVCIDPDVAIFVPNAFTPNDDGINETFFPTGIGIDPNKYELWIFDRWGNLIFYTNDWNKAWDGKVQGHDNLCQIDTYVWKIKCLDVMGHKHNLIGKVSLVR